MKAHWLWFAAAFLAALLLCGAAAAEDQSYVSIFPRESVAVSESLDFDFGLFDTAKDQYVHVLREEADGTYTVLAVVRAWDAAGQTSMTRIEAGVITEPGDYWLILSPNPEDTAVDSWSGTAAPFKALEKKLDTPVIDGVEHGSVARTDVRCVVTFPEGTVMGYTEVGRVVDGTFITDFWSESGSRFSALGLCLTEPGTYQIRAFACSHAFGEPVSETVADSDMAVYAFTLAAGDVPPCPTPVLSVAEADYDPDQICNVTFTIPGAGAVAYAYGVYNPVTDEAGISTGLPSGCTPGETDSISAMEGPGEYRITCWGLFNGVWSAPGEAVFTLNPLGYLDAPAIIWQDRPVEDALQIGAQEPPVFSVVCENAETISCEVLVRLDEFGYDWLDWIDCPVDRTGTAVVDLSGLGLTDGTYSLRFIPSRDGWLACGEQTVTLTVGEAPEDRP